LARGATLKVSPAVSNNQRGYPECGGCIAPRTKLCEKFGKDEMKREALLRELRQYARERGLDFIIKTGRGKGSHYRVYLGDRASTVQSGELTPFHVDRVRKQLGMK
jgi:hypothetical protein